MIRVLQQHLLNAKLNRLSIEGIEVANMIRKGQFKPGLCPFAQFAELAAQPEDVKVIFRPKLNVATKPYVHLAHLQGGGRTTVSS